MKVSILTNFLSSYTSQKNTSAYMSLQGRSYWEHAYILVTVAYFANLNNSW